MRLASGSTLGPYEIVAQLGQGGMGVVYEATDPRLKRTVAIKLLPPELTRDDTAKERFLQEARAASALDHPNICTIHEIDETDDGQLYLVMAHYDGETLKQRIARGALDSDDAIDIATQVGQGLAAAHQAGIVHRDIKPANLMLTPGGLVKILDFGLAKLTDQTHMTHQAGTVLGTVAYMSPEQARGNEVDRRSDLWSLGVVLYEALTGRRPFPGESTTVVLNGILTAVPEPLEQVRPDVPLPVRRVVSRALEKDCTRRYQDVDELLADLRFCHGDSGSGGVGVAAQTHRAIPSIAVLAFADLSPEKDQEYFCDGLTDELIDALARLEHLQVVARTSAFQFKGTAQDVRRIGEQLNVEWVLEGSVRKAGARLRITAQLISVRDGFHVWSEKYDRELHDVFAVQEDIAQSIAATLKVRLVEDLSGPLVKRPTDNLEAFSHYLRGRHYYHRQTRAAFTSSLECFEQAAEAEPGYAQPFAGMANTHVALAILGWERPREVMPKAKAAALHALELDDTIAAAHESFAQYLHWYEWDWPAAEGEFRHATELAPGDADIHSSFSEFLALRSQSDDAIAEATRAVELDPLSLIAIRQLANVMYLAHQFERALEGAEKVLAREPAFFPARWLVAQTKVAMGACAEAVTAAEQATIYAADDPLSQSMLAWTCACAGQDDRAHAIADQLKQRRKSGYFPASFIAWPYLRLGQNDEAFEWLEVALEERDSLLVYLKFQPDLGSVAAVAGSDPRFHDVLERIESGGGGSTRRSGEDA